MALAPAKINLALHVTGQRADGYHLLDSLVVFTDFGDHVTLDADAPLGLSVTGPYGGGVPGGADNLILRAAALIGATRGHITLDKRLPPASGMGGGTSDAATALRLWAAALDLPLPGTPAQMRLGADLPLCLMAPKACRMQGLGEGLDPVADMPRLAMVLANPGVELSTPQVFRALEQRVNPPLPPIPRFADAPALCDWLAGTRNDLEPPAMQALPQIATLKAEIAAQPGCLLARMTGSGATVFGIFTTRAAAEGAARALAQPGRFVAACESLGA